MKTLWPRLKEMNKSGLMPLGQAVLVKPYESQLKSNRIAIPDAVQERFAMVEQRAIVVAVGPEAWARERVRLLGIPLWRRLRARPGDRVLVSKHAGYMAKGTEDGQQYRMVNGNDIFAKIVMEAA